MIISYDLSKGKQKVNENRNKNSQNGNVLVYVLIAIVLFAALGFTLSRQTQNSSTKEIDSAKADILAMDMLSYSVQAKSVIDQMVFTGSNIAGLVFTLPSEAGFSTSPHIHKVFHPEGGGLTLANLPAKAKAQTLSTPPAGWYLGRFNNIEWSKDSGTDVILTAHQIAKPICESINKNITGSVAIPALSGSLSNYLVDTGTNNDLTAVVCAACDGYMSLCVSNSAADTYSFYSVLW